ncbi:MAG: hypothetical protein K2G51_05375 [Lachnospiraceae bacterium]|nr:hypothetical protein [Lachnospiraceae bacterium]MDE7272208.1 hypothetical protein [Lachnospiraceae bacterium]
MIIQFLKRCTAAVIAISVLSTGLMANAAGSDPAAQVYSDSEWDLPALDGEQIPYDQYLSALLDVYYRNDSQAFVALGLGTAEDAALLYNEMLDSELLSMEIEAILGIECPEVLENDLRALMAQMLGSVRYAVTGCELQADGTYEITIIYEQMIIFKPLMELYMAVVIDLYTTWFEDYVSAPSEEDMMIQILAALCSSLRACLENVTYAEPAITTVSIEPHNGVYLPNMEDIASLESLLFDTDFIKY